LHESERVHSETVDDDNHKVQSFFNSLISDDFYIDFG